MIGLYNNYHNFDKIEKYKAQKKSKIYKKIDIFHNGNETWDKIEKKMLGKLKEKINCKKWNTKEFARLTKMITLNFLNSCIPFRQKCA